MDHFSSLSLDTYLTQVSPDGPALDVEDTSPGEKLDRFVLVNHEKEGKGDGMCVLCTIA